MSGQKFDTLTQNRISNKRFLIRLLIVLVVFFSAGVILNHWTSKVNKKPTKAEKERKLIESLNITLENNLWYENCLIDCFNLFRLIRFILLVFR